MGGGRYNRDVNEVPESREDVFTHQGHATDSRKARHPSRREVHPLLNIKNEVRECRDSDEHPETTPIVIVMDVTKSRGDDAVVVYQKLPLLIGNIQMSGLVEHPCLSISAVGDATSGDFAPVQVSQFESDTRLDEALSKVWLEEGGGGTGQESYELLAYYYARKTELDCLDRGQKGILFFLGDEGFYPNVSRDQVRVLIGDEIPSDIPTPEIFRELQEKYDTYFIFPRTSWEDRVNSIDQEIAGRVRNAGGMIEGVSVRVSLLWNNNNDLDIHVISPSGEEIFYGHKKSRCGGYLDVDMNVKGETTKPVENIRWEKGKAPKGHYTVYVQNFARHPGENGRKCEAATEFRVEIEIDGKVQHFEGKTPEGATGACSDTPVFEFDYDPSKGIVVEDPHEAYHDDVILGQWKSVLPSENILSIQSPRACVDTMIGVISLVRGGKTLEEYIQEMRDRDQTDERCEDVGKALEALSKVGPSSEVSPDVFDKAGKAPAKKRRRKRR